MKLSAVPGHPSFFLYCLAVTSFILPPWGRLGALPGAGAPKASFYIWEANLAVVQQPVLARVNLAAGQHSSVELVVILALIPIVVAFSFIVFIFYRQKREAHFNQTQTELKLSMAEVEIKALRAQINPHFIFNCLNSIHHYMHRNDIKQAGDYLVKFSHLIRHTLETSSSKMIPLEDELEALRHYIQLEQLRLDHSFAFEIIVEEIIGGKAIEVPPMLIQPFVENSIWHGLNKKGKGGKLLIFLSLENEMIKCVIEDNGVEGSYKEIHDLSSMKKTSLGMTLINERLEVLNRLYKVKAHFTLTDIMNEMNQKQGKRVELILPFDE